jgi:hypothetical protein
MAAPVPTMTATVNMPLLAELLQTNHDLRREVLDLRVELSARVQAIEAHLTSQRTDHSTLTIPSQDLVHESRLGHEDLHIDQDLHDQINGNLHQDVHVQQDVQSPQDDQTQQNNHVDQDSNRDTTRISSPSIDQGLTIMDHVSPPPAVGHKRKRTAKPAVGTSPYISHSVFVLRGSDTQLAQRRAEDFGPSRSESPFDSINDRPDPSSDRLDYIPPVRPQSIPLPPSRRRPQRSQAVVEHSDVDETNDLKQKEITMRYD